MPAIAGSRRRWTSRYIPTNGAAISASAAITAGHEIRTPSPAPAPYSAVE
jgi:hypothetical protein